jgi:hypothetical protein
VKFHTKREGYNFRNKFLQILGILNIVLKQNLVKRQPQVNVYNILATALLLYGCEVGALKQRDIRKLKTAETKFMS